MTSAALAVIETTGAENDMIADLLAGLDDNEAIEGFGEEDFAGDASEVIESMIEAAAPLDVDHETLEAAIGDVVRADARTALYSEQEAQAASDAVAPETTVEDLTAPADPKADKIKKAAAAKLAKETAKAEKAKAKAAADALKPPKEAKTPAATSVTHKPGQLLLAKLGAKAADYLVFSLNDATTLDDAGLKVKADAFIEILDNREGTAIKVKEKCLQLFSTLTKGGAMNKVMATAFKLLATDGHLTSGSKGNLETALRAVPLSERTSASQANQMFMLLPLLNLTVKAKGIMEPNPDSALLPTIYANLGLTQAV